MEITKEFRINREIKASNVLVINSDGSKLGVLSLRDALNQSESQSLDLVQVSAGNVENNVPPTCRIMDYGKYCYEQDKKSKEAKKNQKVTVLKEIRFSVNIGEGDFETKLRQAKNFLEQGNKLKIVIKFRGRENNNPSRGFEIMNRFAAECDEISKIESKAQVEGKSMIMILSSKVVQTKAKQQNKSKENVKDGIQKTVSDENGTESNANVKQEDGLEQEPDNFDIVKGQNSTEKLDKTDSESNNLNEESEEVGKQVNKTT